jgi:hypothetical protein
VLMRRGRRSAFLPCSGSCRFFSGASHVAG